MPTTVKVQVQSHFQVLKPDHDEVLTSKELKKYLCSKGLLCWSPSPLVQAL